jgi:hypothetical protein
MLFGIAERTSMPDPYRTTFLYGLFMDADVLQASGVRPREPRPAHVENYALRIGKRATLVPLPGVRVHGMTYLLTQDELDTLYSGPGLANYQPVTLIAHIDQNTTIPALCYNLALAPDPTEINHDYVKQLKAVVKKLGFPDDYVRSIS